MVTIKDIAKACNCAVSTVSYALNNDHRIPEETKLFIVEKARELGYVGKSGKKKVDKNYIKQIVLCVYTINGDLYTEIFNSIHHILHISNCKTLIYCGDKVDNIQWMDGLICLNAKISRRQIEELTYKKIPVVLMDREEHINNASNILIDNFQGGYDVTRRCLEKGCKKFIYISGPSSNTDSSLRMNGFLKALKQNGINPNSVILYRGDYTKDSGRNIANNILSLKLDFDCICCGNDEMAEGVMEILDKNNYVIGKDVFVSGFDGLTSRSRIGYITGYYDRNNWASISAYTLLRKFEKNVNSSLKIPVEVVEY